jgi:hypothetical protein
MLPGVQAQAAAVLVAVALAVVNKVNLGPASLGWSRAGTRVFCYAVEVFRIEIRLAEANRHNGQDKARLWVKL